MKESRWSHIDIPLYLLTALATAMGLLCIFDAGYARSLQSTGSHLPPEFLGQIKFLVIAIAVSFGLVRLSADFWQRAAKYLWLVSLVLVVAVDFVGKDLNGARRWLGYGPVMFQPAEFAKIACVIYLAAIFAKRSEWKAKATRDFPGWLDHVAVPKFKRCWPAILVLVAVGFTVKEPDLGTGAMIAVIAFSMFIPGGVSRWSLAAAVALALVMSVVLVMKEPYRLERVANHIHRWEAKNMDDVGYQTVQSETAMANGGAWGVGIGAGRAKHVMPATTTDFIMATIGEEFGLLGALAVIGVLGALVWRLLYLAQRSVDRFRMLVLYGVAAWIAIQASVNIMMANGFLPAIGIPLPFFSSGGSSLLSLWLAIGVCQAMLSPVRVEEKDSEARGHWRGNRGAHLSGPRRRAVRKPAGSSAPVPRIPTGTRG